jgi:hypothetical protein
MKVANVEKIHSHRVSLAWEAHVAGASCGPCVVRRVQGTTFELLPVIHVEEVKRNWKKRIKTET